MNVDRSQVSFSHPGSTGQSPPASLQLVPFDPSFAAAIVDWVETDEQLRWVAPSTRKPLTMEKVVAWKRPEGEAFLLIRPGDAMPVGYGELNPMRHDPSQCWLGHLIVRPDQRGRRVGQVLVHLFVEKAFETSCASRVVLVVFPDNASAVACYRRVGFREVREEYHRFGGLGPRERLLRFEIEPEDIRPGLVWDHSCA